MTTATALPAFGAPADPGEGQRLLDEGLRHQRRGDLEGALELFRRAFEASGAPEVLRLICQVELKLDMRIEAHRDLDKLLAFPSLEEEVRSKAEGAKQHLEKSLVRLQLKGVPPGASAQVDGVATEGPIWRYPGPHLVTVEAPGYQPFTWKGQLIAGERKDLMVRLNLVSLPLPPLRLRDVSWGFAVMGVGASTLVAGSVAGVAAIVREDQSKDLCPERCKPAGLGLNHEAQRYARVSNIALASGAVITAAGLGLTLWLGLRGRAAGPHRMARVPLRVSIAAGQDRGNLALEGRW